MLERFEESMQDFCPKPSFILYFWHSLKIGLCVKSVGSQELGFYDTQENQINVFMNR